MVATKRNGERVNIRPGQALTGNLFVSIELDARDLEQLDFTDPRILEWWSKSLALKFPPMRFKSSESIG